MTNADDTFCSVIGAEVNTKFHGSIVLKELKWEESLSILKITDLPPCENCKSLPIRTWLTSFRTSRVNEEEKDSRLKR